MDQLKQEKQRKSLNFQLLSKRMTSKYPRPEDIIDFRPSEISADRDWEKFDGDH